jgi:hypothetical protein
LKLEPFIAAITAGFNAASLASSPSVIVVKGCPAEVVEGPYFALSLLIRTRRSELIAARWTDVDLEQMTLRIPETKAGRSHLLPPPTAAVSIFESQP